MRLLAAGRQLKEKRVIFSTGAISPHRTCIGKKSGKIGFDHRAHNKCYYDGIFDLSIEQNMVPIDVMKWPLDRYLLLPTLLKHRAGSIKLSNTSFHCKSNGR